MSASAATRFPSARLASARSRMSSSLRRIATGAVLLGYTRSPHCDETPDSELTVRPNVLLRNRRSRRVVSPGVAPAWSCASTAYDGCASSARPVGSNELLLSSPELVEYV